MTCTWPLLLEQSTRTGDYPSVPCGTKTRDLETTHVPRDSDLASEVMVRLSKGRPCGGRGEGNSQWPVPTTHGHAKGRSKLQGAITPTSCLEQAPRCRGTPFQARLEEAVCKMPCPRRGNPSLNWVSEDRKGLFTCVLNAFPLSVTRRCGRTREGPSFSRCAPQNVAANRHDSGFGVKTTRTEGRDQKDDDVPEGG